MAIKWGSTYVTAVKWGSTNCTQVKWGSTVVFPNSTGYNGSSFDYPIASGFDNGLVFNFNFRQQNQNIGHLISTSKNNINFSLYKNIEIQYTSTKPTLGNQIAWGSLTGDGEVWGPGATKLYTSSANNYNCSNINSTGTLTLYPYFQYNGTGKPDLTVNLTITKIAFS